MPNRNNKPSTKENILLAALELFSQMGYDEATIDMIGEKAGIRGPSIYGHFKGKEAILDAVIEMMDERYNEKFGDKDHITNFPGSLEELKLECLRKVEFTLTDSQIKMVRKFCAKEQFRNSKLAELTSKHQLTGNQEMFSKILEKMFDEGLIKSGDMDFLAMELVSPITVLIEIADRQPDRMQEIKVLVEKHIDYFIDRIKID